MRIRKHAKLSPLLYATSSLNPQTLLQTHICQLNQSPWDVMTFSPPSSPPPPPPLPPPTPQSQLDGDDIYEQNVSSLDSIHVIERDGFNGGYRGEYHGGSTTTDEAEPPPVILCGKTDGKSWQCRREAAKGNSLCEHHLSQLRNYNNSSNHSINKKLEHFVGDQTHKKHEKLVEPGGGQRRPRPKKAPSSSNPHEFYYYSGFGPRWGKKRGEVSKNNVGSNVSRNLDNESNSLMLSQFDEEIDYDDEEDDDEDEENGEKRKKKARKPIKERSLKSLM
ncbi:hypothetical protein BUALT_Bualt13G0023800 [Buddleja alternifolia]|uniref:WRC domain-containing protein n=1 Tax=Buddleja alternifolia TaxID=168488 RepID=A0AAV6WI68_9LAMI|nr:hypothetical protein BUALT_Bualt13G0023800 [Buddleja alternifolia]